MKFEREAEHETSRAEMLARVQPLLSQAGVTRLANITGLDRVGIPVVVAVRPNGRVLSQAAGKGTTLEQARVSAAMEAIEVYHAETASPSSIRAAYDELATNYAVVPREKLPLSRHSLFSPRVAEDWTFGFDLLRRVQTAVPLDLVTLPMRTARPSSRFSFQSTSNGLAAGNAYLEAVTAGLLEVIERDAVYACRGAREWSGRPIPRLRLESALVWPTARTLLERIERAGVRALVYDCTIDTVPVYWALLYDAAERRLGLAEGSGAALNPESALVRALTEAAQARAVAIAGARDDRSGRDVVRERLTDNGRAIDALEAQPATVDVRSPAGSLPMTVEQQLAVLLERLERIGVEQAIVVELTLPAFHDAVRVVRVIVPGLDGPQAADDGPSTRSLRLSLQAVA